MVISFSLLGNLRQQGSDYIAALNIAFIKFLISYSAYRSLGRRNSIENMMQNSLAKTFMARVMFEICHATS